VESVKPYCIDSDVLIDHLRGVEEARTFLLEASKQTTLYISVVSMVELYAGLETEVLQNQLLRVE
jgi:predicted nucleic acid-binding protein